MTNSIEIQGLVKGYSSFALGPVDLAVPAGAIVGLIGGERGGQDHPAQMPAGRRPA